MSGNGEEDWLVALEQQEQNQLSSKVSQIYALHDFKIYDSDSFTHGQSQVGN